MKLAALAVILASSASYSQLAVVDNNDPSKNAIACTLPVTNYSNKTYIPPREWVKERLENRSNPCSTIEVNYVNFPTDISGNPGPEQEAFQFAVDIWETLLSSPVTIRIGANWTSLDAGTLGSASSAFFAEVPEGGTNTLYAAALAESIVGSEINGTNSIDIICSFNSEFENWYFGTDGNPQVNEFDFVSVVLHELGHGLGVAGFGIRIGDDPDFQGNIRRGATGTTLPPNAEYFSIWDTFIDDASLFGNPISILNELNYPDPSNAMLNAFTNNALTCNSPIATAQNGNFHPKIYAPSNFGPGSSYSHWDELTFNNTPNALMTPFLGQGEAIHDPGNVTLGFMEDMGWTLCQGSLSTNDFAIDDSVKINPNPFADSITVTLLQHADEEFTASIIDINGREVLDKKDFTANGKITISNLSNLESALYFLKVESKTSNLSITKKVIKN